MRMYYRLCVLALWVPLLSSAGSSQVFNFPSSNAGMTPYTGLVGIVQETMLDRSLWLIDGANRSPLETPGGSVSKLDLKAPGKARREYEKGYQLLMKKDLAGAVVHLNAATSIYPSFVAAYNALGSAYLSLGQHDQARTAFNQAVVLDDHLPTSYFNLGCAELALKNYSPAEQSMQKASGIAPLDLNLLTALAYSQYMNQNFPAVIKTAEQVHDRKHDGAAMVHFFAAAAWEAQQNYSEAQRELDTLLKEDPKSPATAQAHLMMLQLKDEASRPIAPTSKLKITFTEIPAEAPTGPVQLPEHVRKLMQEAKENSQLAEAEAADACPACSSTEAATPSASNPAPNLPPNRSATKYDGYTFRSSADEVAIFFAATDHGKSVTNLTLQDVGVLDNSKQPAAVTGFRNESELPLRLGLVIDTSASIASRFKFEQEAAAHFMQTVVTGPDDLAFVVGFANSVLLVQDFTRDESLVTHAVGQLAPSGGTALWDAVSFAAEKLAGRSETKPVARILVVISDGDDNSSSVTAKQAIHRAESGDIITYTVSTRDFTDTAENSFVGEHALRTLAELTGGAAFAPGSVRGLNSSLAALQQVIRSRYLLSYKPAQFQRDGQYRAIDISAEKGGHKLHVYARKGYIASTSASLQDRD